MNMTTIKSCFSFFTINSGSKAIHLSSNFSFTVKRDINTPTITADITINNQYTTRINLKPKVGDTCFISIQNDRSKKTLIFKGKISSISLALNKMTLSASYECIDSKIYEETYLKADTKKILESFVPKLQFEATNQEHINITLKHAKPENLRKMLDIHKMNYFINLENQVVIMDKLLRKEAKQFDISNCSRGTENSKIIIFPIPELEIGDIVVALGKKHYVTGITYKYASSVKMKLGVKECLS